MLQTTFGHSGDLFERRPCSTGDHLREFTTPVIIFGEENAADQCKLLLNMSTSAAGFIRAEIQDAEGRPLPNYRLDQSEELIGDQLNRVMTWKGQSNLAELIG